MQRPPANPLDVLPVTTLGKRGALPSLENNKPLKRLATREDAPPSLSPQTAVAGRQPRYPR